MAADTKSDKAASPLGLLMVKLSDTVYVWRPELPREIKSDPKLILLLGWADARDPYLAKYVKDYQTRYPSSTLLLIKARMAVLFSRAIARHDVAAALPIIAGALRETEDKTPGLLIHLFSNGGSCLLSTLYDVWPSYVKSEKSSTLPLHITIFDSAPSTRFDRASAVTAIMAGIPRGIIYMLIWPIVKAMSFIWWIQFNVLRFPDVMVRLATAQNDRSKVREVRRAYIYSDKDALVQSRQVEEHAKDATRKGFTVFEELFVGSPHVAHVRADPTRYWQIVDRTWRGI